MLISTIKLICTFLVHCMKRFIIEVIKLVSRIADNGKCENLNYSHPSSEYDSLIEYIFCIDSYTLHDKDTEFTFKVGFINVKGDLKVNGRVEGLKNLNQVRNSFYCKGNVMCTMVEFEASQLNIHYDGIVKLLSIGPSFLINAVLKNVKILIEYRIYPFECITLCIENVTIGELEIITIISGLKVISWIINLMIKMFLKLTSFMILCFLEFHAKCYLKETFLKFHMSQNYATEKIIKNLVQRKKLANIEASLKAEIVILNEMSRKSESGPTSYIYNLMTGLYDFNKAFSKVITAELFGNNLKDFIWKAADVKPEKNNSYVSSTIDSDITLSSTSFSDSFDNSELHHEYRIASDKSSTPNDSHSTNHDLRDEIVSISESNSENEIVSQSDTDSNDGSKLIEKSYNENDSRCENNSTEENSQSEKSYEECNSTPPMNASNDESSFQCDQSEFDQNSDQKENDSFSQDDILREDNSKDKDDNPLEKWSKEEEKYVHSYRISDNVEDTN